MLQDQPYGKKSDVWAAGCVLYELSTLERPFRGGSVSGAPEGFAVLLLQLHAQVLPCSFLLL